MRQFQKSDYAINKVKNGIVYEFSDGCRVEISLADYLKENPDKTKADFRKLKELSDEIYYEQDRADTRFAKHRISMGKLEETEQLSVPSIYITMMQGLDEENILKAAELLLKSGKLTEIQKRRFILHFFKGMSYRQIARQEQVNFTAVQASMKWATKKLRKIFEKF